ncbi:MAG: hypothetical protein AAFO77_02145, partial [Pseudomonadota bacterium]
VFRRSDGLSAFFQNVDINIDEGSLATQTPVRVERPGQQLTAQTASILDGGNRLIFEGNVRIVVQPDTATPDAGEAGQ